MDEEPVFEVVQHKDRTLVICTYKGQQGTARVFSKGEADARDRAEVQARAKAAAQAAP